VTERAFAVDQDVDRARRTTPASLRAARVRELLKTRLPADAEAAVKILRDRRQGGGTLLPAGHNGTVLDLPAVQTALLDAAQLVIWVSEGPGAGGRFRAFDLRYLLRGEGSRPAPPPDIPADGEIDPAQASAVLEAEELLLGARQALGRGATEKATELTARALVRSPDLPAALRLAGDCARAAGDHEGARELYRRYLELADNPGMAEQIRAYLSN
jgi:hypothetical protein